MIIMHTCDHPPVFKSANPVDIFHESVHLPWVKRLYSAGPPIPQTWECAQEAAAGTDYSR